MADSDGSLERFWSGNRYLSFFLVAVFTIGALYLGLRDEPPSIGKAIGILGVAAVVISLRPKLGGWERGGWMLVCLLLCRVEYRAIDANDRANQKVVTDQAAAFQAIKDQMTASQTADQSEFSKTLSKLQIVQQKTQSAAETATEAVNQLTGGDSYAYYSVLPSNGQVYNDDLIPGLKGKLLFYGRIKHIGKYPIQFMNVSWTCPKQQSVNGPTPIGPIIRSAITNNGDLWLVFPPDGKAESADDACIIWMDSPNGHLSEYIYAVKLKNSWSWVMTLQRAAPHYFRKWFRGDGVPKEFKIPPGGILFSDEEIASFAKHPRQAKKILDERRHLADSTP